MDHRGTGFPLRAMAAAVCACLLNNSALDAAEPVGAWDFDNPAAPLEATVGSPLQLVGTHTLLIPGAHGEDGAVRVGIGSHYVCTHGIAPPSGASLVNRFSLLIDFRVPSIGPWYCFFQTNPSNQTDGDCFVQANTGTLGVGSTGYSSTPVTANLWQRLLVTVDNSLGLYRVYLDGTLILNGSSQAVDGRFALAPTLLLFADDDAEDAPIDVTRVAIYNVALSAAEAAELAGPDFGDLPNQIPSVNTPAAGPTQAATGQSVVYRVTATDPDSDPVQVQMDWGDGGALSGWSTLVTPGQPATVSHTYKLPGTFPIRAMARDSRGGTSAWTDVAVLTVTGAPIVNALTPPFLQNVTTDGITIMWELDAAAAAEVEYGFTPEYGSRQTAAVTDSGAGTLIYRARLSGLEPGSTYHYRTVLEGTPGPDAMFQTAPAGSPDFSFSVWADSQGSNHGTHPADPLEPTKSMMQHMADTGIDLALTAGDLAENGASYSDTHQYYLDRVASLLGTTVPWYPAWGNHDSGRDAVIRKFADLPSQDRPGFTPGYGSYSFDYAGCHFICIDHATRSTDILSWLEQDLQSAANRNARFTFLFVHVPPYCELWIDGDSFHRTHLVPLMEAYGVDVCFSGHTHEYSRGLLNGVHYCITGGGSWLDTPESLVADWPHMTVGGRHPIAGVPQLGGTHGGGLINEYVRVDVTGNAFTASMIGFNPDGTVVGVLDQFSVSLAPNPNPPAAPTIAGPATVDVFRTASLVLESSAFSDPDDGDTHLQSLWRLSRSINLESAAEVVLDEATGPGVITCAVDTAAIAPGQTLYAGVRHLDAAGHVSPFSTAIAIRILPDPVHREDFESTAESSLPPGWIATHRTTANVNTSDPDDPQSNTYLTWTVISADRLSRVFGANRVNVPGVVQGHSVYAESDQRSGIQIQHLTSPDFSLELVTDAVLSFRSNYMQNQDSLGAVEYSIDGGAHWLPVVYWLDAADVVLTQGQTTVDGNATFTRIDPDNVPLANGSAASGGTYGEHILSRPFSALGPYVQHRTNDDAVGSKRIERFPLPDAAGQPRVRFRFTLVGTASWFWGIDDFALYGTRADNEPILVTRVRTAPGAIDLEWTGPDGPFQVEFRASLDAGAWHDLGQPIDAAQRSIRLEASGATGFYRIRLAR
ncbi:MAG TPA: metallophosphoesterase [Verrucomicrobiota bacterium]|nr:metallophosphoesterase [Verrucomicrobiota bacterium]HNU53040.1 metallophosphoesterase [Verrucomicrobiota bacterium]